MRGAKTGVLSPAEDMGIGGGSNSDLKAAAAQGVILAASSFPPSRFDPSVMAAEGDFSLGQASIQCLVSLWQVSGQECSFDVPSMPFANNG